MTVISRASAEAWYLRDAIRDALYTRTPQTGPELFRRVESEYGYLDHRRMWRYLAWLIQRGIAVRVGGWRATNTDEARGYVRGPGTETSDDTAERKLCELASSNRCVTCQCRVPANRPKWMRRQCSRCYWAVRLQWKKAQRWNRIANHQCARCGHSKPRPGLTECAKCGRRDRPYHKERYMAFVGAGICTDCNGDYAVPWSTRCEDCRERRRKRDAARKAA